MDIAAGTYILALLGVPEEDPTNMPTSWTRFVVEPVEDDAQSVEAVERCGAFAC